MTNPPVLTRARELETFERARVSSGGFVIPDLQSEIRHTYSLKEDVSLDRMSLVIGFALNGRTLSSRHFSYKIPDRYRYIIKPHKAIGDAARMLLVAQEFCHYPREFEAGVTDHMREYEAQKNPGEDLKTG